MLWRWQSKVSPTRLHESRRSPLGGGHGTSGASSSDGGIVIDLSRYLKTVTLETTAGLIHVGGGANWRDVDQLTVPQGFGTVAGTVDHVSQA